MAISWTDELKAQVIADYKAAQPTADNSTEIVKDIAESLDGASPNGVRAVLVQAGVYVKKDAPSATKTSTATKDGAKAPRVSKESQIAELKAAIEARNVEVDADILDKLTGKAAAYFVKVLAS